MKKIFSIVIALALVLTMVVASVAPAAAVSAPIIVTLSNPVAKEASNYTMTFHNIGTLLGDLCTDGDYIDIMFPFGTDVSYVDAIGEVTVFKGPSRATANTPVPICPPPFAIGASTLRVYLDPTPLNNITKCEYVRIEVLNVTNPFPCQHHIEIETSVHTAVNSECYTVYCIMIPLVGGLTPWGAPKMNLISIPCYPEDESIEYVLEDLFLEVAKTGRKGVPFNFSVWYWDANELEWLIYASDTSFDDLETIEPGKAYWIKPDYDIDIYIHGYPYIPGQGPPVKFCWYKRSFNMVGFVCTEARNITQYLAYTTIPPMYISAVMAVWGWNPTAQAYYDQGWPAITSTPSDLLNPGEGYWMAFLDTACIIPPPDCDC